MSIEVKNKEIAKKVLLQKVFEDIGLRHTFLEKSVFEEVASFVSFNCFWLPINIKYPSDQELEDYLESKITDFVNQPKRNKKWVNKILSKWNISQENKKRLYQELREKVRLIVLREVIPLCRRTLKENQIQNSLYLTETSHFCLKENLFYPILLRDILIYQKDTSFQGAMLRFQLYLNTGKPADIENITYLHNLIDGYIQLRKDMRAFLDNIDWMEYYFQLFLAIIKKTPKFYYIKRVKG